MKKIFVLTALVIFLCSFETLIRSSQPPQGRTGADGTYCTGCHGTNPLNSPGGTVQVAGLPSQYSPGTAYNFSLQINHSAANRRRWGFSIEARNSANQAVGTFSTTNTNAAINGNELSHLNAQLFTASSASYTYSNLTWTAPANPGPNDNNITFYFVGLAADGSSSANDFTYSNTLSMSRLVVQTYTFTGSGNWSNPANWSNNVIPPATITGNNTNIVIDPAAGGECVLDVEQRISNSATLTVMPGKLFRVQGNLTINN